MTNQTPVGDLVERLRAEADLFEQEAMKAPNGFRAEIEDATSELLSEAADTLSALTIRAETAERERDEACVLLAHERALGVKTRDQRDYYRGRDDEGAKMEQEAIARADAAEARLATLEQALAFYADPNNYRGEFVPGGVTESGSYSIAHHINLVRKDGGERARAILAEKAPK